jgi:hypothetical protein
MFQRSRHRLALVILTVMLCQLAAIAGSGFVQAAASSCADHVGQCCCEGTGRMCTCPMSRSQAGVKCRIRCDSKEPIVTLFALPGLPPPFVHSVDLSSEPFVRSDRTDVDDVALPVPYLPPR